MNVDNLNLKNLKIEKDVNTKIPKNLNLTEKDIIAFNKRKFTPQNINKIIALTLFLGVEDYNTFIINNTVGSKEYYNVSEIYKGKIMLPFFMTQKSPSTDNLDFNILNDISVYATEYGLINWLKFGYKNDYGWNYNMYCVQKRYRLYNLAIKSEQYKVLQLINHYHMKDNKGKGISFEFDSMRYALKTSNNTIPKYLFENKCKIDFFQIIPTIIDADNYESFKFFYNHFRVHDSHINHIIRLNRLKMFQFLDKIDYNFSWDIAKKMVIFGNLDFLKYIISRYWFIEKDTAAYILFSKGFDFEKQYIIPLSQELKKVCIDYKREELLEYINFDNLDKLKSSIK